MKVIAPTIAKVCLLDVAGNSYVLELAMGNAIAKNSVVLVDGSSYTVEISPLQTNNQSVLLADGSSYIAGLQVIDVQNAATEEIVVPPHVDTIDESVLSLNYKSKGYLNPIPLDSTLFLKYLSNATVESVTFGLSNTLTGGLTTESSSVSLTRYHTPVTSYRSMVRFVFTVPAYVNVIQKPLSLTYGVFPLVSFYFHYNNLFLSDTLKSTKHIPSQYTESFVFPVSYDVASPLSITVSVNYDVCGEFKKEFSIPAPLYDAISVSKDIIHSSFDRITSLLNIDYLVKDRVVTPYQVLISDPSIDYIHNSAAISYSVNERLETPIPILISDPDIANLNLSVGVEYLISDTVVTKKLNITYHSTTPVSNAVSFSYDISEMDRVVAQKSIRFVYVQEVIPFNTPFDLSLLPLSSNLDSAIFQGATLQDNADGTTLITTVTGAIYLSTMSGTIIPISNTGSILSQSQYIDIIAVEPMIIINNEYVFVTEMDISIDEGNFTYTLNAKLGNYSDLTKFTPSAEFHAVLQGEPYTFMVDSRSINRQEVNAPVASIKGVSLANKYTGNRSQQIIGITFTEGETAREMALRLLSDNAINKTEHLMPPEMLSWEILDWEIPPFRFGVENTYPLDGVKNLAEAVGGVIESYPDGKIRVRYKHPVRVPDYSDAVISHSFYDADDIISIEEQYAPNRKVDSIYVKTFQDIGVSDTIEFFDTPGLANVEFGGFVRVFPAFWRDSIELSTTRTWDVELEYMGIELWRPGEIDPPDFGWETIEIVRSQGSTRYPIHSIVGYDYINVDCGEIMLQDYSKTFYTRSEVNRYSLIKMSYLTKCHKWRVKAPAGAHIQFLIRDNVFNAYLR